MTLGRRQFVGIGAAMGALASAPGMAAGLKPASTRIPLWIEGAPEPAPAGLRERFEDRAKPGATPDRALTGVSTPWLEHFAPKRPTGAALIAIPGGGYHHMAWDKEGLDIARLFAARGIASFALAYRLTQEGWPDGLDAPLADAQRAVRLIRSRAAEFDIDPARIAVVGFSAGGHLTANLAAQFDRVTYAPRDAADRLSARPDLAAPIYPAVMLERLAGAMPAGQPLFGVPMSAETLALHSPDRQARSDAPPHFLVHAEDDPLVGAEHSLALRSALFARKVPVETHLFARGGHGFGVRNTAGLPVADWPQRLLAYGRTTGWIT